MCHSIENRNPFLESSFIKYVFGIDTKYFCNHGIPKFMLRKSLEEKLPKFLINGKKVGRPFNLPFYIKHFYVNEFEKVVKKTLIRNFDKNRILASFKKDIDDNNNDKFRFYFRVLNYAYWKEIFIN